jgi:hypothetical protein
MRILKGWSGGKILIWHMLLTYAEKQGLLALNNRQDMGGLDNEFIN